MRYVLALMAMVLITVGMVFISGPKLYDGLIGMGLVIVGAACAFGAAADADDRC